MSGETPLVKAAERGHTDGVKLLLDAGADKDVKDMDGKTPLDWAAGSDTDIVKLLLDAGAEVGMKDGLGLAAAFGGRHIEATLTSYPPD